jgi:subtilase family serine protease
VSATGTAGDFDSALSVSQKQYHVPAQAGHNGSNGLPAQTVHGNVGSPLLPYRLSNFVLAILGLSNYAPFADHATKALTSLSKPQAGSSNSCLATFGLSNGCHLPSFFTSTYNLNPLLAHHATGSGQTIGIVTLATVDPGAPEHFWSNISHTNRTGSFTQDNIDGGSGTPSATSGSDETDLDVEQSGAIAPGANVIAYQAPNTDPGFADAFFTAASQNVASDVSASWGESETIITASVASGVETATYAAAFDESFLEMAIQGQSAFTSSADDGAYTASADLGTTNLSADFPADSPYITAAGGTTLPWTGTFTGPAGSATFTVPAQRIWGWDYLWQPIATSNGVPLLTAAESAIGGSGGGFSTFYPAPSYQNEVSGTHNFHAVQYLTPADFTTVAPGLTEPTAWTLNPAPPVTSGYSGGRAVPDLSTDADPETGYLVYGASVGGINEFGGTSFVAPQLNAATAVIDSFLGHRVGFWNPSIYAAAASGHDPFTQLNQASTSNDNLYYTGNPGQKYNQGIGLGIPNLAELTGDFTR